MARKLTKRNKKVSRRYRKRRSFSRKNFKGGFFTKCCKPGHEPDDTNGKNDCKTIITGMCGLNNSEYTDKYRKEWAIGSENYSPDAEVWVKQKE
jgi:hypothetical protein